MTVPCKDCPKRWVDAKTGKNCHSECAEYQAFVEYRKELNKKTSEENALRRAHVMRVEKCMKYAKPRRKE